MRQETRVNGLDVAPSKVAKANRSVIPAEALIKEFFLLAQRDGPCKVDIFDAAEGKALGRVPATVVEPLAQ